MAGNVYTEIIGPNVFKAYKQANNDERQKIHAEVIRKIREINEFPYPILTFEQEISSLRSLIEIDAHKLYDEDKCEINTYSVGVDVLYKYYPNIFEATKTVMPISVYEGFYTEKRLNRAVKKCLTYESSMDAITRWLRMTGCGYCNNFRPASAKVIYDINTKGHGARVYDFAAGYGGRLLGAWAAENVTEYLGVDVNTKTVENHQKFIEYLGKHYPNLSSAEVKLCGSQDFTVEQFPEYRGYFDIAFSSPQYFDTEVYCDEPTQSCKLFPKYEGWVRGFLRPTIHNAIDVLKPDGVFAINIFDKVDQIKKIIQVICAEKDYKLYKVDKYLMPTMPGSDGTKPRDFSRSNNMEPVFYFKRV